MDQLYRQLTFLITIVLLPYPAALACSVPPDHFFVNPDRMLTLSEGVVLAQPVDHHPSDDEHFLPVFDFKVVERLHASDAIETFSLHGYRDDSGAYLIDFNQHSDLAFWGSSSSGNSRMPGDCGAYGVFQTGKTYLIFVGLSHPKAYELIEDEDDKWLELIRYIATEKL